MLQNDHLAATFSFDTAENELWEVDILTSSTIIFVRIIDKYS